MSVKKDELGFRPVPWEYDFADRNRDDKIYPPDETPDSGPKCAAKYGTLRWHCTRERDHDGTHRAGDGTIIAAEWWAES